MGTNTTRSNKTFTPTPRMAGGSTSNIIRNTSPFFYGVVIFIDPSNRSIQYDVLENNIGTGKIGNAIPSYKDNITLPQINDVVPLFTAPSFESGLIGEQYTKTVYYLNPISNLGELSENGLVRTPEFSFVPAEVAPSQQDYLTSDIGFSLINNEESGNISLAPQINGYTLYEANSKLPNGRTVPKGYVVTIPKANTSKNLALVFGGMYYATPSWMEDKVSVTFKSNKVFVFADSWKSNIKLAGAIKFISETFAGYNITSVSGFSLGGYQAWEAARERKYNFVGLIDPSTSASDAKGAYKSPNVIMVYRPNNWVGSGNIKSNQIIAAKQMGANAIYVQTPVKTELIQPISPPRDYTDNNKFNHDLIPKWFFENYGGKL
jgi:hypothetical protein